MSTSDSTFSTFKNIFYALYIIVSAFFLMNDYKITTMVLMALLVPVIIGMEHRDAVRRAD